MPKYVMMLLAIGLLVVTEGCGNSSSTPTGQVNATASDSTSDETIVEVARTFLEAVRTGNSADATAQLTPLAQQRMRAADMDFELLASPTASYQVGRVERLEAGEAIVESLWIEPDANGQSQQENWTLALQRNDQEGSWNILGIVAEMGAGQPPVVMDFEKPGQIASPTNTASAPQRSVPQQATRPVAQDPFRQ